MYCGQIFRRTWDWLGVTMAIAYVGHISYLNGSFISFDDLDGILACGFKVHPVLEVSESKVMVALLVIHPLDCWGCTWWFIARAGVRMVWWCSSGGNQFA
jgi:hypothetical protein